jgi:hypothetical protein
MMRKSLDHPMVAFSVRVYQVFLIAYPAQFRQEYGSHMIQVFRDGCLRVVRQDGTKGILRFWAVTLLDLIQSVISEHIQKETQMSREMKTEDIRRAGWALILGATSFVLGFFLAIAEYSNGDWSLLALLSLVFVSLPLLVFGVLGLRNRYGENVGSFGKNILLIGAILGPLTSVLGFFLMSVEPLWFVIYTGPAVLFVCLTLFGVVALHTKPLPRWNILPILAGLWYPVIILSYLAISLTTGDWSGSRIPDIVNIILITIQGVALLALGYILKADIPEEKVVIA